MLLWTYSRILTIVPLYFQIVKVWSEDGAGKVVEIPADMTAKDVCQLLVYKSHCLDDNAWTLVEHHPILGLGKNVCVYTFMAVMTSFRPKWHHDLLWGQPILIWVQIFLQQKLVAFDLLTSKAVSCCSKCDFYTTNCNAYQKNMSWRFLSAWESGEKSRLKGRRAKVFTIFSFVCL